MLDFFYWLHLHVEHNMKDDLEINRKISKAKSISMIINRYSQVL